MIELSSNAIRSDTNRINVAIDQQQPQLWFCDNVIGSPRGLASGRYVFRKDREIPLVTVAVTCSNTSAASSFEYNVRTGEFQNVVNTTIASVAYPHINNLRSAINVCDGVIYKGTVVQSMLSSTSAAAATEIGYFTANVGFNSGAYSLSVRAPAVIHSNVTLTQNLFESSVGSVLVDQHVLKFTNIVKTNPLYYSIVVQFT